MPQEVVAVVAVLREVVAVIAVLRKVVAVLAVELAGTVARAAEPGAKEWEVAWAEAAVVALAWGTTGKLEA